MNFNLLLPLFLAAGVSYFATPWVIKAAWKFGLIDDPKTNKHEKVIHTKPTPRAGGLAIYFGVLASSLVFLPLDKHLVGILTGATLLVILGLLDDKLNLNPYFRFGIQILAALVVVSFGIGISFATNPLTSQVIDLSHPRQEISFVVFVAQ